MRIKHLIPALPGYCAVYHAPHRPDGLERVPVVCWAVSEQVEYDGVAEGEEGDPNGTRTDAIDAFVVGHIGAEPAIDRDGLLGITYPGDNTNWTAQIAVHLDTQRHIAEIVNRLGGTAGDRATASPGAAENDATMRRELPDAAWAAVAVLLPERPARRTGGRPPLTNRKALAGVLYVLRRQIRWQDLPRAAGLGSGLTCWRKLREWQRAALWDRVVQAVRPLLPDAEAIEWSRVANYAGRARALSASPTRKPRRAEPTSVPQRPSPTARRDRGRRK